MCLPACCAACLPAAHACLPAAPAAPACLPAAPARLPAAPACLLCRLPAAPACLLRRLPAAPACLPRPLCPVPRGTLAPAPCLPGRAKPTRSWECRHPRRRLASMGAAEGQALAQLAGSPLSEPGFYCHLWFAASNAPEAALPAEVAAMLSQLGSTPWLVGWPCAWAWEQPQRWCGAACMSINRLALLPASLRCTAACCTSFPRPEMEGSDPKTHAHTHIHASADACQGTGVRANKRATRAALRSSKPHLHAYSPECMLCCNHRPAGTWRAGRYGIHRDAALRPAQEPAACAGAAAAQRRVACRGGGGSGGACAGHREHSVAGEHCIQNAWPACAGMHQHVTVGVFAGQLGQHTSRARMLQVRCLFHPQARTLRCPSCPLTRRVPVCCIPLKCRNTATPPTRTWDSSSAHAARLLWRQD